MLHPPQVLHALRSAQHLRPRLAPPPPSVLIAGAAGALGTEVLHHLAGSMRYAQVHVITQEPMRVGMGRLTATCMPKVPLAQWPVLHADVGVVMFEAPRMFYQRERALYVPHPAQLEALAGWMRHCGVRTLAVVMPYAQGTLPLSVAAGFASLSEQVVSSLGFETVVWVRSAEKKVAPRAQNFWLRVRDLMLSTFPLMVPQTQQPLRAIHVAQAVAIALQHAPPGVHVLSHEKIRECLQAKLPNAAPMTATIAAHTTGASWFPPPGSSP